MTHARPVLAIAFALAIASTGLLASCNGDRPLDALRVKLLERPGEHDLLDWLKAPFGHPEAARA